MNTTVFSLSLRACLMVIVILGCLPIQVRAANSMVINEIQIAGQTSKDEFVELYNAGDVAIDLTGWRLTKKTASGNEANLVTTFPSSTIPPRGFFLIVSADYKGTASPDIAYTTGNTIADDNTVLLYRDAGDTVVDKVGFGKAGDREGVVAVNPDEGKSISRRDGADSDDNNRDFIVGTPSPTNRSGSIGSTPVVSLPTTPTPMPASSADPTASPPPKREPPPAVVVNEVYPNPPGPDDDEFIELKNIGERAVDMSLWELGVGRGRRFIIPRGTILASMGLVVYDRRTTGLALENTDDVVALYQPEEERPFFTVRYRDDAPEGQSYARSDSGKRWQWTTTRTPGAANVLADPPMPPILAFSFTPENPETGTAVTFDASDSFDPDREVLTLAWEFGDGEKADGALVQHTYVYGGRYTVRLVGTTVTASTTREQMIVVRGALAPTPTPTASLQIPAATRTTIEEGDVLSVEDDRKKETQPQATQTISPLPQIEKRSPIADTLPRPVILQPGTIRGTVLVPPGKFGKTRILLRTDDAVYTAQYVRGTWPVMEAGDTVMVAGRVSPSDPSRFLVREIVSVTSNGSTELEPVAILASEVAETPLGTFVEVSGEITERHGGIVFLDDGKGEVKVQLRSTTGITPATMQEGARATIRGIVLEASGEKVIVPRGLEDVTIVESVQEPSRSSVPWRVVSTRRPFLYGGIVFGSALAATGVVLMRRRRNGARVSEDEKPPRVIEDVDREGDDDG